MNDIRCVLVAALDERRCIGDEGAIPWDIPEDLERFRSLTMSHPVVMGRKTYDSIVERNGQPLEGRWTVVLSRSMDVPEWEGTVVAESISHAASVAEMLARSSGKQKYFVAGGATVYEQFLDEGLVNRMQLTEVNGEHHGDAFFPEYDITTWDEADAVARDGYRFVTYER